MRLSRIMLALINNPERQLIQWRSGAPLLKQLGGRADALRVLEVGRGRDVGVAVAGDSN